MLLVESPLILLTSALSSSLKPKTVLLHLFSLQLSGGASLSQKLKAGHSDTAFPNSESSRLVHNKFSGNDGLNSALQFHLSQNNQRSFLLRPIPWSQRLRIVPQSVEKVERGRSPSAVSVRCELLPFSNVSTLFILTPSPRPSYRPSERGARNRRSRRLSWPERRTRPRGRHSYPHRTHPGTQSTSTRWWRR